MISTPTTEPDPGLVRIAAWSAGVGFFTVLMVAAATGRLLLNEPAASATKLGALGFTLALAAPYLVVLAAFISPWPEYRRAVWLVSGVLSLGLAAATIFSGAWLLFGPVGIGLLWAWWLGRVQAGGRDTAGAIALTCWLLLCLGGALVAVLLLRDTPACWEDGWVAASPNECGSDIVDDLEGLLALTGVTLGPAGLALFGRVGNWSAA